MTTMKISLPGFDVKSSHISEEVIDSLYPNPKIDTKASPVHAGIIDVNYAGASLVAPLDGVIVIYSFPHNYSYVPTVLGNFRFDNGVVVRYGILPTGFVLSAGGVLTIDADPTNINLKYISLNNSTTISAFLLKVRFYVMAERGVSS